MTALPAFYADNALYLWLASLVLIAVLAATVVGMRRKVDRMLAQYQRLVRGASPLDLSEALDAQLRRIDDIAGRADQVAAHCNTLDARLDRALQHVATIRFNPFGDAGGDQSFSVALLDGRGDGVVFSSLFGRADCRVFAKPVVAGSSRYTLSDEEQRAITEAIEPPEPAKAS